MAGERIGSIPESSCSRRTFMTTTGGAIVGAAAFGLGGLAQAAASGSRHPNRGGTLRFATRGDATGLDPHRNIMYLVSQPLAATTQGLLDLNLRCEPAPGIAVEWDISTDLLTYTFKLRQGVLFHNGQEVDAAAVKWNFEHIKNPQTSHAFTRLAVAPSSSCVGCAVNAQNRKAGLPEVEMGIAIHTSAVLVGNIGSQKRTKYAAVGSHVNLTGALSLTP